MSYSPLDEQWLHVRSLLPNDFEELARNHGAMRRKRGEIKDAETLLRLILLHVGGGLSLDQTVVRAREQGLAALSAVALFKRLKSSEKWLAALTAGMLREMPAAKLPSLGGRYRIRALDATFIQEPGSTGTDWRLHYSLKLPELVCDFFEITDATGAEHLKRLPVRKGDLVLADRGYSKRSGIAAVLDAGADVVVRLIPSAVPLLDENRERIDLPGLLKNSLSDAGAILEKPVWIEHGGKLFALRLCALRKTQAATDVARRNAKYERERKGGSVREVTLEYAAFVLVLTSLTAEIVSGEEILALYRCRWQIELAFKRLKSLLNTGHLPKKDPESCRAWMQAKVLLALLTDRLILESELFSPWGHRLR
jgi:hypothetical protein